MEIPEKSLFYTLYNLTCMILKMGYDENTNREQIANNIQ